MSKHKYSLCIAQNNSFLFIFLAENVSVGFVAFMQLHSKETQANAVKLMQKRHFYRPMDP